MNHASSRNACCWPAEDGSWAGTDFARFGNHISSDESVGDSDCSMPEHEKEAWLEYQCAIGALENIDGRDDDCQFHATSSDCHMAGPGIVLLRSDGTIVLHGKCTGWHRCVPVLTGGVTYTGVSCGAVGPFLDHGSYVVLLASDGTAVPLLWEPRAESVVPALSDGTVYTQASASCGHIALVKTDGTAVAYGSNQLGQCNLPAVSGGVFYVRVGVGEEHTALLKSDGTAVVCGGRGDMSIPSLDAGVVYTHVAAGSWHTVLLKSDGGATSFGSNEYGQCNIPDLPEGVSYVEVACGAYHTVLLKSDGAAAAYGDNKRGQCDILVLSDGVTYTNVIAVGIFYTVLLKSDGAPVLFGYYEGDCNFPELPEGVTYVGSGDHTILTMMVCATHAAFVLLCGRELCKIAIDASDTVIEVRSAFMKERSADHGKFRVVLPNGQLLSALCAQAPSTIIEHLLARKRARRQ